MVQSNFSNLNFLLIKLWKIFEQLSCQKISFSNVFFFQLSFSEFFCFRFFYFLNLEDWVMRTENDSLIVVISSNTTFSFYFGLSESSLVSTLFSIHFRSDRHLSSKPLTWLTDRKGPNGFHAWRVLAPILPTVTKNISLR